MSNILHIIRPDSRICKILVDMLPMARERFPESRVITEAEYLAIEAGEMQADMSMGYSIMLDEAPTSVEVVTPTENPTTLDLGNYTKAELLACIIEIQPDSEITMNNSKSEMIEAIASLDQTLVQAYFA